MKPWLFVTAILCCGCWSGLSDGVNAQPGSDTTGTVADLGAVPITIDNFVRAATDIEFEKYVSLAGGVNQFYHFREPTPVDNQPTIRMNRDTLYSTAVVDISEGATLTLPDVGERYMSAMIVNQDHYINEVFSDGGTYTLDMERFDTPYVIVFVRTLVDAADPEDVAAVNAIQNQFAIEAASSKPFTLPNYDKGRYEAMVSTLLPLGAFVPSDSIGTFGSKETTDPIRHLLGTALGWGGLPESEANYDACRAGPARGRIQDRGACRRACRRVLVDQSLQCQRLLRTQWPQRLQCEQRDGQAKRRRLHDRAPRRVR